MATVVPNKAALRYYYNNTGETSWFESSPPTCSTRAGISGSVSGGQIYRQDSYAGAFKFSLYENFQPDSGNVKTLTLRLGATTTSQQKGTLYLGFFSYDVLADAQNGYPYASDITIPSYDGGTAQVIDLKPYLSKTSSYIATLGIGIRFGPPSPTVTYPENVVWFSNASGDNTYITYELYTTAAPGSLSPNGVSRNPNSAITLSWLFNKGDSPTETQTGANLRYSINGGAWNNVNGLGVANTHTFPAGRFAAGNTIRWQVQTISTVGTSDWSAQASFTLAITPPLAAILTYPLNISVTGANGVMLEWTYNSQYDTKPSRFDVRYRIDGGAWVEKSNSGQLSMMTEPIAMQCKVEWQVLPYGEFGDVGPWSDIGTFYVIGMPEAPVIVEVTNSNRPTVYFSAVNVLSWELEVIRDYATVYGSGNVPFNNEFSHRLTGFLENGNYLARMRVYNEYGLSSGWAELAFTIDTIPPDAPRLKTGDNPQYGIDLYFGNDNGETVYIFRSEFEKDAYRCIGKTIGNNYSDYTVRPRQRYKYFVRVVGADDGYADSNAVSGAVNFLETTLAECDNPDDMLMFLKQFGGKPQKNMSFEAEKTLTQFVGRKSPVLQVGEVTGKSIAFSFYCSVADYERLEALAQSEKVLLLRDWRVGALCGTITAGPQAKAQGLDTCIVTFTFTQTFYDEEVALE